jgi:hypothetical protein
VLLIIGLVIAQQVKGVHNAGEAYQQNLIKDKNNIGIALSNCVDKTNVSTQAAILQSQSVQQILTSALAARYQGTGNPQTQALPNNGSLISALQEQYPDVDVSTWKQLLVVVDSCRDDTTDAQNTLQGDAALFVTWTLQGNVFSSGIHHGYPNKNLYFLDAHGNRLTGQAALDAIRNPVLLDSARNANSTGSEQQQNLPGYPTSPSATPSK